ncbi:MAG: aminotransferase class I/II-fold pyridoxal phosphate-dependent enzyme [Candidatus Staskawiczbacteria bacterium]|nr:aminotransferase class I/II-fold pyridoxal phosphate-dependent enzyme [Candidatus Staskawiczbacteria bacterium]
MKRIEKALNYIKKFGLYPESPVVSSPHAPETIVNGKKVLLFATNNYLGLMHDERVVAAAVEGVKKWGIGNGSARLLTGNIEIHQQLEKKIAEFKHREAGISFVSGYMANSGAIPAIANVFKPSIKSLLGGKIEREKDTIIFSDEYNHASIIAGIRLSGAQKEIYKHTDVGDLKNKLSKYPVKARKMIVTDGVFSMDGDTAPLPDILDLAKKYNALVYLDDAHATGILGKNGRGLEDYFGLENKVDVVMGTFTKSFGGVGGFIVGRKILIDYLKIASDSFIFTAPIAPPVVYGLIKAIEIAEKEPWRRKKLLENAEYLRGKLKELNFNTGASNTQIMPIIIGDEKKAMQASNLLLERNIFIPAARWPAVPQKQARLRTTLTCDHTFEQIDYLVDTLVEIRKKIKF